VSRKRRGKGNLPAFNNFRAGAATAEREFRPGAGWFLEKDFAFVRLGSHLLKTFPLCEATNTEEWIPEQIDISAFRGQGLSLSFQVVNDASEWSNFFVDTVFISTE
jgi:hypothetical protein